MTFMDDVVFLLETAGVAQSRVSLFEGPKAQLPSGNGPYITLIETGGAGPEGTHNTIDVPAYVSPGAEVIVTALDKVTAKAMAIRVYQVLFPVRNRLVNGTWWREVHLTQEPFDLTPDLAMGRARVAFNFTCVKRYSPATS